MSFRPRRSLRPVRPRLPRRAIPWYAAALLLAGATGLLVASALRRADAAEGAYGTSRPVAVVARDVAAGEVVTAADVVVRRWPSVLVPPGALATAPTGRTARADLVAGEAVADRRLGPPGAGGGTALLAAGQRAVPVPITVPGLDLRPGDRVDVLSGGGPGGGPAGDLPVGATGPDVVAAGATVVDVAEEAVVVAVAASVAPDVAAALTAGPLVLALRPPGG
ncbi:MAG TPA: Flp pilus assembly protein CpaB [Acidimicrobiales bacterium]|nr:Flp pilus assembly protein CpaB [Acidimicrobiales bacterium]